MTEHRVDRPFSATRELAELAMLRQIRLHIALTEDIEQEIAQRRPVNPRRRPDRD